MRGGALAKLRGKARHGLLLQEILNRLGRKGVWVSPYLVYREQASPGVRTDAPDGDFEFRPLRAGDVPLIAALAGRKLPAAVYERRFAAGALAAGAFDGERLVAYTWADVERFPGLGNAPPLRTLQSDEAYLYDAYTEHDYRGKAIIPALRAFLYELLRETGRHRYYSVSLCLNRSARRFKEKLGAREAELRLSLGLFRRLHRDFLLRSYPE